jgi:hypothetical protein
MKQMLFVISIFSSLFCANLTLNDFGVVPYRINPDTNNIQAINNYLKYCSDSNLVAVIPDFYTVSGVLYTDAEIRGEYPGEIISSDYYGSSQYNNSYYIGSKGCGFLWKTSQNTHILPLSSSVRKTKLTNLKLVCKSNNGLGGDTLIKVGNGSTEFCVKNVIDNCQIGNFQVGGYLPEIAGATIQNTTFRGCKRALKIGRNDNYLSTQIRVYNSNFEGCGNYNEPFIDIVNGFSVIFRDCIMQGTSWINVHRIIDQLRFEGVWWEAQLTGVFIKASGQTNNLIQKIVFDGCPTGSSTAGDIDLSGSTSGGILVIQNQRSLDADIILNNDQWLYTIGHVHLGNVTVVPAQWMKFSNY